MADNGPSFEVAPLKGSFLLDLDQFDESIDSVEDKLISLSDLFKVALNPNIDVNFDDFDNSIKSAISEVHELTNNLHGLSKNIDLNIDTHIDTTNIDDLHDITNSTGSNVSDKELQDLFNPADIEQASILEQEMNNVKSSAEEAKTQVDELAQALGTIADRSEEAWLGGFEDAAAESESLLSKFDSAMLAQDQYLASGINATFENESIFKGGESDTEGDDSDLDPANVTGYGGGMLMGGDPERRESSGLGSGMMEKGMMLSWTLTPMLLRADKSLLKLGFTSQAAFNMANREFGKNSDIVTQWSKNTVKNLGLSSGSAMSMADRFGMSALSMGANKSQAADLGERMTTLADQMSLATSGQVSLQSASQILTGVMGGQMYGLKQLGITFSSSQQNAEAAALGYGHVYSKLTPLQQAYVNTTLVQDSLNKSLGTLHGNLGTAYGQWSQTKAQLEQNAETMVEKLLPAILKVMKGISKLVSKFSHLGKAGDIFIASLLAIGTVIGPVIVIFDGLRRIIEGVIGIFKFFGRILKGSKKDLEDVGDAAEDAGKHSKGIIDIFKDIGKWVGDAIDTIIEWGGKIIEVVGDILDFCDPITLAITAIVAIVATAAVEIYKHWSAIKKFVETGLKDISKEFKKFGKFAANVFHEIVGKIKKDVHSIINFVKDIPKDIKTILDKIGSYISKECHKFYEYVKNVVKNIYEAIYNNPIIHGIGYVLFEIRHLILSVIGDIGDIIGAFFKFIWSWIKHFFNEAKNGIINFFEYIGGKIKDAFDDVKGKVENFFDWIGSKIEAGYDYIKNKSRNFCIWAAEEIVKPTNDIKKGMRDFYNYVKSGIHDAVQIFKDVWGDLCSWFDSYVVAPAKAVWGAMKSFAHYIGDGIHDAVQVFKDGWHGLCSWFDTEVEEPIQSVLNTAGKWLNAGENLIKALWQGIKNIFGDVTSWIGNKISDLTSDLTGFTHDATSTLSRASYHGSHATGLSNVPWDGYSAELHKGEMVLTKDQADQYRIGGSSNGGVNLTINSPSPLDPFETKRLMEQYSRNLANGLY